MAEGLSVLKRVCVHSVRESEPRDISCCFSKGGREVAPMSGGPNVSLILNMQIIIVLSITNRWGMGTLLGLFGCECLEGCWRAWTRTRQSGNGRAHMWRRLSERADVKYGI